ncbi:SEC-C metal-binding domain-containing protein [Bradyrhizobium sp.]|uniref:SEC-C metal-binding domain-containing protein n=1 Tax=Bradyrhizobium sp. TaxID=376 RepID=UPI003C6FC4B4
MDCFSDAIEKLSHGTGLQPESSRGEAARNGGRSTPELPECDPFRNVGRNHPCPCGTGKKFRT